MLPKKIVFLLKSLQRETNPKATLEAPSVDSIAEILQVCSLTWHSLSLPAVFSISSAPEYCITWIRSYKILSKYFPVYHFLEVIKFMEGDKWHKRERERERERERAQTALHDEPPSLHPADSYCGQPVNS